MKTFKITEAQLQEIAGRLNALTVQGIANAQMIAGITGVLDAVGASEISAEPKHDNVVKLPDKDNAHG